MNAYLLLPILAASASIALATWILARDPGARVNRRAALLVGGGAFWAVCEILWNTATDPEVALRLVKLSSLGWIAIGPLGLDVLHEISSARSGAVRRALPWLYATSVAFLAIDLLTPWIHPGVVATRFGTGYELGAAYLAFYPFTAGCLLSGLALASRSLGRSDSPSERTQTVFVALGVTVPLVVASATDGLLPFFGTQVVHLGTSSFVFLGSTIAWSFQRYGHSLLAPSAFAREILETLPDGVALVHPDGRIRTANPGLARLLGADAAELVDVDLASRLAGASLDGPEGERDECRLTTTAGGFVPVAAAWRTLHDKRGHEFGRVVVLRDVRELVDLRARLVTAGRLASVGELAAGISHEINNPIAFVGTNLSTLRDYWAELSKETGAPAELVHEGEELIEESLEGVERVKTIVRDVKSFAHSGDASFHAVDLNGLLDAALRLARPQLGTGIRVVRCLGDVPTVNASARHLQQVFLNLIVNAAQAVGGEGSLRVLTLRGAGHVEVRIEDDGDGIAPELLERVFDPFFTTKTPGEGMGLGLSISYQIVRDHAGEIRIESEPGRGTAVRVLLPVERAEGASERAPQSPAPASR